MPTASPLPKSTKETERENAQLERLGPGLYVAWQIAKGLGLIVGGTLLCLLAGAALTTGIYGVAEFWMWLGVEF